MDKGKKVSVAAPNTALFVMGFSFLWLAGGLPSFEDISNIGMADVRCLAGYSTYLIVFAAAGLIVILCRLFRLRSFMLAAVPIACVFGVLGRELLMMQSSVLFCCLAFAFQALSAAILFSAWGLAALRFSSDLVPFLLIVSIALSGLFYPIAVFVGLRGETLVNCAMLASALIWIGVFSQSVSVAGDGKVDLGGKTPFVMASLLLVVLSLLSVALLDSLTVTYLSDNSRFISSVCIVGLLLGMAVSWLLSMKQGVKLDKLEQVLLIVMALLFAGVMVSVQFSDSAVGYARPVLASVETCLEVVLFSVIVRLCKDSSFAHVACFLFFGLLASRAVSMFVQSVTAASSLFSFVAPNEAVKAVSILVFLMMAALTVVLICVRPAPNVLEVPVVVSRRDICETTAKRYGITDREVDVLYLVYCGHSAKRIAENLCVSESTVKSHTSSIYRKMGVHSKQQLIEAIDDGV